MLHKQHNASVAAQAVAPAAAIIVNVELKFRPYPFPFTTLIKGGCSGPGRKENKKEEKESGIAKKRINKNIGFLGGTYCTKKVG